MVRRGLRQILLGECRCQSTGEACAWDALAAIEARSWHAVILGVSMPQGGLDLLRQIRKEVSRVVWLTSLPEVHYAGEALRAGALGYLTKRDSIAELTKGLLHVLEGKSYICSAVADTQGLFGRLPHELLSEREYSVLVAIASGKRLTQIASDLHVNSKTISTYRRRVLEKMKMESNADLVCYALRHIALGSSGPDREGRSKYGVGRCGNRNRDGSGQIPIVVAGTTTILK